MNYVFNSQVPNWNQLPTYVQDDFRTAKFESWYKDPMNDDERRLTLINAYLKLRSLGLWEFVNGPRSSNPQDMEKKGALEFFTQNPNNFLFELTRRGDFAHPSTQNNDRDEWTSREQVDKYSLHLKHHGGWNKEWIEAHIDPTGLSWNPLTWLPHLWEKITDGYQEVYEINAGLRHSGYSLDRVHRFHINLMPPLTTSSFNVLDQLDPHHRFHDLDYAGHYSHINLAPPPTTSSSSILDQLDPHHQLHDLEHAGHHSHINLAPPPTTSSSGTLTNNPFGGSFDK